MTGENGILTQANKAKTETNNANIEEQVKLAFLGSYGTDGNLDYSQLAKNLEKIEKIEGVQDTITEGSFPLTVTVGGEEIKIFDDGTIFNSGEWDKTASDEECFYWESDDPNNEGYGTVIGYTSKIENYTKLRYPSRCTKITFLDYRLQNKVGISTETSREFTNNILKVEIPRTVTLIEGTAFGHLSYSSGVSDSFRNLKEIVISSSITSINYGAFEYCTNLSSITIPSSVSSMGNGVFYGWTSSQTINIQGYTSAPSGWDSNWNSGCSATINWGQ